MFTLADWLKSVRGYPRAEIAPKELAAILGISVAALASKRQRKTGPPAVDRDGFRPYYDRTEVCDWLEAQIERNAAGRLPVNPAPSPGFAP